MQVIWFGQSCFQILTLPVKNGQVSIVIDPFAEDVGLKVPSVEANIVMVTHDHHDHNNTKAAKGNPFIIDSPGEYEIKGVFMQGIPSFHDDSQGKQRGRNTIYTIETEDMKICHLGDLGQKELTSDQLEKIGSIDLLMVPVGGTSTIDSKDSVKIISQIEPKIVIPMHYLLPRLKVKLDDVDKFLKAMGSKAIVSQNKLTIKQKDLPEEDTQQIVILNP